MKSPRMPNATRPPMTPAKIMTSGRSAPFRMRTGRITLSMVTARIRPTSRGGPHRPPAPPYRLSGRVHGLLSRPSGEAPRETAGPRGRRFALGIEDRGDDHDQKELEEHHQEAAGLCRKPAQGLS